MIRVNGRDTELPFPKLEKGTTADVIRQKLGNPLQIQSVPSPEGKAEVWIYTYQESQGMTQSATRTVDTPAMALSLSETGMMTTKDPSYSLSAERFDITLSLLMYNDQLQVQKVEVQTETDQR